MVHKALHGLALCSKFEKRETVYNLRDSENKLIVPLPHNTMALCFGTDSARSKTYC